MSIVKRQGHYHVERQWSRLHIRKSCYTKNKARAQHIDEVLGRLHDAGRFDLLELLVDCRLELRDLVAAWDQGRSALEHAKARAESPILGPLLDEFLEWMASPAGISLRTKRPYSVTTVIRYRSSWNAMIETLEYGRDTALTGLTDGWMADYPNLRKRVIGGVERQISDVPLEQATLNRDKAALGGFLTWVEHVKGIAVIRPRITRVRESQGRIRWLSSEEIEVFRANCGDEWWPYFAALVYTGARANEVRRLRGADVFLREGRLAVHEEDRPTKTAGSVRDLPVAPPLKEALAPHMTRLGVGAGDMLFPDAYQVDKKVRQSWDRTCAAADITGATPRDLRHTFGVHAAMAGIPPTEIQDLMGHVSIAMTMRYMRFAPSSRMSEDAARIAAHMHATPEADARRGASLKEA